jgi:molybdopterin/thiamine biosynthesis adenylyltransferase
VVVGDTPAGLDVPSFHAGSRGWVARLSTAGPVGSGTSTNPFGAGAAACLAAANVFRTVFAGQLADGRPDAELTLSISDFSRSACDPALGPLDVGETHLVGLGAIGNGVVWALARLPGLTGELHLVDHEEADLSNLQRYVMTGQDGVDRPKVETSAEALAGSSLRVVPHQLRWGGYIQERGDWRLDRVVVALDSAKDRLAVQGSLPRRILNAWTAPDDLGVSRHGFADGKACLACLYLPAGKVEDEDVRVARELGVPEAFMQVRSLLATGAPVDAAFIATVAERQGVPFDALLPFVGQPLRTFYGRAMCGGVVFRLTGGAKGDRATVPMAFQSALAGIMLAAELVKDVSAMAAAPTVATRLNLTRPLAEHLHDPMAQDPTGRCLCRDPDFVEAYQRKYVA